MWWHLDQKSWLLAEGTWKCRTLGTNQSESSSMRRASKRFALG
ncbi:hypothetical protein CB0940_02153 [Cercospora beticola]|uniref:Uncharacterized protein n=1 Tax=Cercospora beticola TaxID=122368 RepID=A0A2G5IBC6_CERBT|nr:hypothetical protein CB0940_02153 [Cercospora beticola]PIB02002.1 hypothetical protein CB0940_02153 [Cercospora beticola]